MLSRRIFLKKGTIGAVAGVSLGLSDKIIGRDTSALGSQSSVLGRAAFASQLNTTFTIRVGARDVELKLVEVVNLGSKPDGRNLREAFALGFRGDNSAPLKQGTYAFEHPKLGGFSFLLVPVFSTDPSVRHYEVNVNRLHG